MSHIDGYYARREAAHVKEYAAEATELRRILWALVMSNGGEMHIDDCANAESKFSKCQLETYRDEMRQGTTIKALTTEDQMRDLTYDNVDYTKETTMEPPQIPPKVATGFAGDSAEDLGKKLMNMTLKEVVELVEYLGKRIGKE